MNKWFISAMMLLLSSVSAHDVSDVQMKIEEIKNGFDRVVAEGGNVLLIHGDDGVVMIDDGYERNADALLTLLDQHQLRPKYVINTHWHTDHTGGNEKLGHQAILVGHENIRSRLSTVQEIPLFDMTTEPSSEVALPEITYQQSLSLHLNGQHIQLEYYQDSHTDTDTVVYMMPANIIHTGDLYFAGMFPFIDAGSKGNVDNLVTSLKSVLSRADDQTIIVPGHGPISNKRELQSYVDMLEESARLIRNYQQQGYDVERAIEEGLPEKLVLEWGNGFIDEKTWIGILYETLN